MFLDSHKLYCVVAILGDTGQHVTAEFVVGADTLLVLAHADVRLVDEKRLGVGGEFLYLELIGMFRSVDLGREDLGVVVLNHAARVGGQTFAVATIPIYMELEEVSVVD